MIDEKAFEELQDAVEKVRTLAVTTNRRTVELDEKIAAVDLTSEGHVDRFVETVITRAEKVLADKMSEWLDAVGERLNKIDEFGSVNLKRLNALELRIVELEKVEKNVVDLEALEQRFRTKLGKVHDSSIEHKRYLNGKVDEIIERMEALAARVKRLEKGRRPDAK